MLCAISNKFFSLTLNDYSRLNGYISYVGKSVSVAIPNYKGNVLDHSFKFNELKEPVKSQIKLYFTELYDIQAETLYSDINIANSTNIKALQKQCYVNLNGEYGLETLEDEDDDDENEDEEKEYDDEDRIFESKSLSIKLNQMKQCALLLDIVQRESILFKNKERGCSYVYSKLTKTIFASFKKLFELYGFIVLTTENLTFTKQTYGSYCNSSRIKITGLTPNDNKPKVIFIERKMKKSDREEILKIMSSKENVNGRIIQVMVSSKIFEMGVNIGNIVRMYRLVPELNESTMDQTKDRIFREDSHNNWREYQSEKTGIPINEIIPIVDVYDYCPYYRYFFCNITDVNYFPPNSLKMINEIQLDTFNLNNIESVRFLSQSICHIIGFCKNGAIKNIKVNDIYILDSPLFLICNEGEKPFDKLNELLIDNNSQLYKDFELLNDEEYEVVVFYSGVVQTYKCGNNIFDLLGSKVLIYNQKFDNKHLYKPKNRFDNNYITDGDNNYYAIGLYNDEILFSPLQMQVVSISYSQYLLMEEKSFPTHKVLRPVKQMAIDCISNKLRNVLNPELDNTSVCDYEKCDYKCFSEIVDIPNKDIVIDTNNKFWDNYEIIYSEGIVNECKNKIIDLILSKNGSISFSKI